VLPWAPLEHRLDAVVWSKSGRGSYVATPALADGVMYVRGLNTLFAVSGKAR